MTSTVDLEAVATAAARDLEEVRFLGGWHPD